MIPVKRCDIKNEGLPLIRGYHLTKTNKIRRNKNKRFSRKNAKTVQKNRRR